MTLTADHDTAPETESPAESTPEASTAQRRGVVGWVAAGIALAAAGLLAFLVLADDTAERPDELQVNTASQTVAEHGSISAIDHRDGQLRRRIMLSQTVAERGSISAIEHRDGAGSAAAHAVADRRRARQHQRHRPPRSSR